MGMERAKSLRMGSCIQKGKVKSIVEKRSRGWWDWEPLDQAIPEAFAITGVFSHLRQDIPFVN